MKNLVVDEYGYVSGGYDTLLESFEVPIVLQVDDNDYQGDTRVLLRDGPRWGILIFGWGSCSGCDALQDCSGLAEVTELRDKMWNDIHWEGSVADMYAYVSGKDWPLDYSWHSNATKVFVAKVKEWLAEFGISPASRAMRSTQVNYLRLVHERRCRCRFPSQGGSGTRIAD